MFYEYDGLDRSVDVQHEAVVRRPLAPAEEMEQLAPTAPDGTVFDAC